MSAEDDYLRQVIMKYRIPTGSGSAGSIAAQALVYPLKAWANDYWNSLTFSGSYAKETGVKGTTDLDLFISLKANTPENLKQVFDSLSSYCREKGWAPKPQNVSVRVLFSGLSIDLVPGKVQLGQQNYHSLYTRKNDSWLQTNVALHVSTVTGSGRQEEIRVLKVWRMLHGIEFPSFYLELAAIEALRGKRRGDLAKNVVAALVWLRDYLPIVRLQDPANTNNYVSDTLSGLEKKNISTAAAIALTATSWSTVVS